jgi:hypothetical protein
MKKKQVYTLLASILIFPIYAEINREERLNHTGAQAYWRRYGQPTWKRVKTMSGQGWKWVKEHPKATAAGLIGTGAVLGAGVYGYKKWPQYKQKKELEKQRKDAEYRAQQKGEIDKLWREKNMKRSCSF